nr:V-type proton ATPase 116 kDa subunit a [Paratrimastix eleionoma]
MSEIFRSEKMTYVQLLIQREAAHDTLDELGQMGIVHFLDMNPTVNAAKRQFVGDVRRCDELQRKLRYFIEQIQKCKIETDATVPERMDRNDLETKFEEWEREMRQMNTHEEMLHKHRNELIEMRYVLELAANFFDAAQGGSNEDLLQLQPDEEGKTETVAPTMGNSLRLGFITGVVLRSRLESFHRVVYMALRGNCYLQNAEIPQPILDPASNEETQKNVFVVFFSGQTSQAKISKICESFGANMYPFPEQAQERQATLGQVESRLATLQTVISRTEDLRDKLLRQIGTNLDAWDTFVAKEKSIFTTLNLFSDDASAKCLIGEGWCATRDVSDLNSALDRASKRCHVTVPLIASVLENQNTPPTFFRTNKFTESFQAIVDSYGTANYGEINPALFTIGTFPFLFAVMFGDFGHGVLLLAFALWMVLSEKKLLATKREEMFDLLFYGRYLILLMGCFSIYMGAIYNECFSISNDVFGTGYKYITAQKRWEFVRPYPFGIDPIWRESPINLTFTNSIKMKLSIIIGVTQMMVGIVFHCMNGIHFHRYLDVWFEFVPQILFMGCLFGYLVIMIFIKWWTSYSSPPSLIKTMISMFLDIGHITDDQLLYRGQAGFQTFLVIVAVICVPCMLLPKPLLLLRAHRKGYREIGGETQQNPGAIKEEFAFSELFVTQLIETIEFVLGCVSNTASYLRLWALSLAHGELAAVFWFYGVVFTATMDNAFLAAVCPVFGVVIWLGATAGILMGMESLSAFLHALRLHWVEFQNKFFKADGYAFTPLDFKKVEKVQDSLEPTA